MNKKREKFMCIKEKRNVLICICSVMIASCSQPTNENQAINTESEKDSVKSEIVEKSVVKEIRSSDISFNKNLLYDKYTLEDEYPYKDTTRVFQWNKIREELVKVENAQRTPTSWGILKNRKNINGEAPLVKTFHRNAYKNISDSLGVERYQSIPLYLLTDTLTPERYAHDGSLVHLIDSIGNFIRAEHVYYKSEWLIPKKYVKSIGSLVFTRIAVVDKTNQNITTLERDSLSQELGHWLIRSQNPATTGAHNPPYQKETPLGIFVVQEKKEKMLYLVDGTSQIAGFCPWANRFSNGGYIHGIPVNLPHKSIIEYSNTLGTIPRSHMCVRNASSHAKYVFDWAFLEKSLVIVIE